jgi:hypothetical protein
MKREVMRTKNEFGGKTLMVSYFPDDDEYKNGIANAIIYYDGNGSFVKLESFNTDESANDNGIVKTISDNNKMTVEFYDQKGRLVRILQLSI